MSEKGPNPAEAEKDSKVVSPYEGIDSATLNAIVEAKESIDEQDSRTPSADLRTVVREKLEASGHKDAFRKVYDLNSQELDAFVEGAAVESKGRYISELKSIIEAYNGSSSFADRRTAIREALEAAGDTRAYRTVYDMNNLELTSFIDDARHKLEDQTRMSEDEALEGAYDEYEERESSPYDTDKGRVEDKDNARDLANLEEIRRFIKNNPDMAERFGLPQRLEEVVRREMLTPDEIAAEKATALDAATAENLVRDAEVEASQEEAGRQALGEEETAVTDDELDAEDDEEYMEDERRNDEINENWDRNHRVRAFLRRMHGRALNQLDLLRNGHLRDQNGAEPTQERRSKLRIAAVWGAVAVASFAVGFMAGKHGMHHSVHHTPTGTPSDSGTDFSPKHNIPVPPVHEGDYPWDAVARRFGDANAEGWLHKAGEAAKAAGHKVEWSHVGNNGQEAVTVDGQSGTKYVMDVFGQVM